jgi:hypothetical protein
MMAENKTKATGEDVSRFLDSIPDDVRREDARALTALMQRATGEPPALWGSNIVGFGHYHYRYESGREGDAPPVGFSPRAKELVIYLAADAADREALLARLGKHRTGKSCLYVKRLGEIDQQVLEALVVASVAAVRDRYPA